MRSEAIFLHRNTKITMKQIVSVLVFSMMGLFGQTVYASEMMNTMVFDNEPAVISLETSTGSVTPVQVTIVQVIKMIPSSGETTVSLRTCSVVGCLPNQDVAVGPNEAIVQMDLELLYTPTTDDAGSEKVYFKPQHARFSVDGVSLPVRELRQGSSGSAVEQEPSFYIEPMKKVEQTVFTRIRQDAQSVTFVYSVDANQPELALQACFSEGCNVQRNQVLAALALEKEKKTDTGCQINGKSVPCDELVEKVGFFARMGLFVISGLAIVGLLVTVFWVMMLVHAATHPIEHKAIWILGMLFLTIIVSVAYYFAVKRPSDAAERSVIPPVVPDPSSAPIPPAPPTQRM